VSEAAARTALAAGSPDDKRARLARLLRQCQSDHTSEAYPLSHVQQGLWLIHQRDPGSPAWNEPAVLQLAQVLDLTALARALNQLMDRHPILRTTYALSGQTAVQQARAGQPLPLAMIDAAAWSDEQVDADLDDQIQQPIDLARGPVFRARVLRRGPAGDVLLLVAHHIAIDGLSYLTVVNELFALYLAARDGRDAALPPATSYHEYVRWQRDLLTSPAGQLSQAYWREQLRPAGAAAGRSAGTTPRPAGCRPRILLRAGRAAAGCGEAAGPVPRDHAVYRLADGLPDAAASQQRRR